MRYQQDTLARKLCMYSEIALLGCAACTGANNVVPEKASKLCSEGMASDHIRPTRDDCLSQYVGCKLDDAQRPMVFDLVGSFAQNTSSCVMVRIAGAPRPMMRRTRSMATRGVEISVVEAPQRARVGRGRRPHRLPEGDPWRHVTLASCFPHSWFLPHTA